MRRALPLLGVSLLVLAHLDWARLAFLGGLGAGAALLAFEAAALAAFGLGLHRASRGLAAGALLVAVGVEVAGIFALGVGGVAVVANLGIVAGLLLVARAAWASPAVAALRPGGPVAAASSATYLALDLAEGETFLALGLSLALAGWVLLSWAALTAAAPTGEASRTGSAPRAGE